MMSAPHHCNALLHTAIRTMPALAHVSHKSVFQKSARKGHQAEANDHQCPLQTIINVSASCARRPTTGCTETGVCRILGFRCVARWYLPVLSVVLVTPRRCLRLLQVSLLSSALSLCTRTSAGCATPCVRTTTQDARCRKICPALLVLSDGTIAFGRQARAQGAGHGTAHGVKAGVH